MVFLKNLTIVASCLAVAGGFALSSGVGASNATAGVTAAPGGCPGCVGTGHASRLRSRTFNANRHRTIVVNRNRFEIRNISRNDNDARQNHGNSVRSTDTASSSAAAAGGGGGGGGGGAGQQQQQEQQANNQNNQNNQQPPPPLPVGATG